MFVVLLGFGQRTSAGGPSSGLAVLTCNAMLIILSTAISSGAGTLSFRRLRSGHDEPGLASAGNLETVPHLQEDVVFPALPGAHAKQDRTDP
jgi:hypothetical protein